MKVSFRAKINLFTLQDTSATNFMIRDARMQQLVATEKEPITPFISKVRTLFAVIVQTYVR